MKLANRAESVREILDEERWQRGERHSVLLDSVKRVLARVGDEVEVGARQPARLRRPQLRSQAHQLQPTACRGVLAYLWAFSRTTRMLQLRPLQTAARPSCRTHRRRPKRRSLRTFRLLITRASSRRHLYRTVSMDLPSRQCARCRCRAAASQRITGRQRLRHRSRVRQRGARGRCSVRRPTHSSSPARPPRCLRRCRPEVWPCRRRLQ